MFRHLGPWIAEKRRLCIVGTRGWDTDVSIRAEWNRNGQTARICFCGRKALHVDAEAPAAVISGSGEEQNGVLYAAQAANLQVAIEPDGKSGLKKAAYCIRSSVGRPGSKAAGQQDHLEGSYRRSAGSNF
ncbi:MAG: hypothetical protein ACLTSZ_09000 [Lachnospiraceae bacterium]